MFLGSRPSLHLPSVNTVVHSMVRLLLLLNLVGLFGVRKKNTSISTFLCCLSHC